MFQRIEGEKIIWSWRWPLITIVVLVVLLVIQIFRVNEPRPTVPETRSYSSPGSLAFGDLLIPAEDYHSIRIDLNRRAKVTGTFRTSAISSHVSVLVMNEVDFDNWKLGLDFDPVTQTGYVPAGKISPVLEVGTYFLIIDNRRNDTPQRVRAEFVLE